MIVSGRRLWIALAAFAALGGLAAAWSHGSANRLETEMLALPPDDVPLRAELVSLAVSEAEPVYAAHCAACHGADLKGNTATGAPNLSDNVWLYGKGNVTDIERTILYGIRSAQRRTRDETEMAAFGLSGALTESEIRNVVQYLLSLNRRPNLAEAALAGRAIYSGKGRCGDCHGTDGQGDSYYGAPNLTINVWNNGGDAEALYRSIYYGVERICPAWYRVLPLQQIRALAVYLYSLSHPQTAPSLPQPS
jgi:cytochrome c oxidase cbb3-type subunit 3